MNKYNWWSHIRNIWRNIILITLLSKVDGFILEMYDIVRSCIISYIQIH